MKILIVAPNWIGDAVMSLSLIQALHQDSTLCGADGKPCEIHVLAPPVTAPVYQFSDAVRAVQVEPFAHGKLQWGLRRQVGALLAERAFDTALVLPNSLKSALVPWFARIPKRVGYSGELRTAVLTHTLPKPDKKAKPPMIQWYGNLGGFDAAALQNPMLNVAAGLRQAACAEFQLPPGFLALAPGAEFGPAKRWPASHFAHVATEFLIQNPIQNVVLFGGPKDQAFCGEIVSLLSLDLQPRAQSLAGKTSLAQAVALMSAANQLVTNDSGLMHVAAALNVQVHAVFGSSSPHHTPPLNAKAKVYYLNLECSPCFQRECPLGHTDCLKKLDPKMVVDQLGPASQGV
ncbi:lipopolysaccharide heptosyltransferase II [Limnobacter sp.]|uniref:lipopolysaccharide heptosyltransferase II n=1 Tax=Limnobacter sp. TaxID=2003368 RepID=UPI002FDFC150